MDWRKTIEDLLNDFGDFSLSDEQLDQLLNAMPVMSLAQQMQGFDYQTDYLGYLQDQLGLNAEQLDQARQEGEFQRGPYWKWYTTDYFDMVKRQNEIEGLMNENQLGMSANQLGVSENQMFGSQQNLLQEQERTKQAKMQSELAMLQFLQPMQGGGLPSTSRSQDNRNVRGLAYSYGTVGY